MKLKDSVLTMPFNLFKQKGPNIQNIKSHNKALVGIKYLAVTSSKPTVLISMSLPNIGNIFESLAIDATWNIFSN